MDGLPSAPLVVTGPWRLLTRSRAWYCRGSRGTSGLCGHRAWWREAIRHGRTTTQVPGRALSADGVPDHTGRTRRTDAIMTRELAASPAGGGGRRLFNIST